MSGEPIEIYIIDPLDDDRGYCIDIKGHKFQANINKELQAHTCYSYRGAIAVDQRFDSLKVKRNQFFFTEFDVCMEAVSLSESALIQLKSCNFGRRQNFKWAIKGTIHPISDMKLCLTIDQGVSKKGNGGSPVHLKRNLTLELCNDRIAPYQIWGKRKVN